MHHFGDLFLARLSEFETIYCDFLGNRETSDKALTSHMQNVDFASFLEEQENANGISLSTLMSTPKQVGSPETCQGWK